MLTTPLKRKLVGRNVKSLVKVTLLKWEDQHLTPQLAAEFFPASHSNLVFSRGPRAL